MTERDLYTVLRNGPRRMARIWDFVEMEGHDVEQSRELIFALLGRNVLKITSKGLEWVGPPPGDHK